MNTASMVRLIALSAIWGGSFLFIRIAAPVFGPGILAELRAGLGAVFLWLVCRWLGRRPQLLAHWRHFLKIGLFNSALPFVFFAYAAQTLSASLMSILNSAAPIFGALLGALWLRQSVSRSVALGLACGVAGVATLVGGGAAVRGEAWWSAVIAGLAAPLCYSIASILTRQSPAALTPLDNAQGSMWAAALLVVPAALLLPMQAIPAAHEWAAVAALAVICTGVAYLIFFRLIQDVGPMQALSVTFLIPVFGVLWGVLLLDEKIGWNTLAGGALVLCGTALANGVVKIGRVRAAGR